MLQPYLPGECNIQEERQFPIGPPVVLSSVSRVVTCMDLNFKEVSLQLTPRAGRIQHCAHNWLQITKDPWILEVVKGYRLELEYVPVQHKPAPPLIMNREDIALTEAEVKTMTEKGAIIPVEPCTGQFLMVPKKDGSLRPVVNLKALNKFITHNRFKMEGAHLLKDLLQPGDWMASIDLKDAYFSVPIAKQDRKFLRFRWQGQLFEFQCLPFGLSSVPRVFTELLKPVTALLRQRSVRLILYLDDMLLMAQSQSELKSVVKSVTQLLQLLGFTINWEKSNLSPTQRIQFLGFVVDSVEMTMSLPKEKVTKITQACETMLKQPSTTVQELSRMIGRLTATVQAVLPAPLCYRHLQWLKNEAFRKSHSYSTKSFYNQQQDRSYSGGEITWRDGTGKQFSRSPQI